MTGWDFLLTILGCGLVTYLTRMPALVFSGKIRIPEKAQTFMSYIGPSVITALIANAVFITDQGLDANPLSNIYIFSAVVTVLVCLRFKKPLPAILSGIAAAFLLSLLL